MFLTTDKEMAEIYKGRSEGKEYEVLMKSQWEQVGETYSFSNYCKYREKKDLEVIYVPVHKDGLAEYHYFDFSLEEIKNLIKMDNRFVGYITLVEERT